MSDFYKSGIYFRRTFADEIKLITSNMQKGKMLADTFTLFLKGLSRLVSTEETL